MQTDKISLEQFVIIKHLARVGVRTEGESKSAAAARLYFVEGQTITAAARAADISQPTCRTVVMKMRAALDRVRAFNTLPA
ncbi:MAG: hypothetical protein RPT25_09365 [Cycloclasticus sp.]